MQIAIMGTGNVGRALGAGWVRAGHQVVYGSREPQSEKAQALQAETGATVAAFQAALNGADVVVLAVPWAAVSELLPQLSGWDGKVLIDATNPIAPGLRSAAEAGRSGAQLVAALAPGARVVKAFNTTGAENMRNPIYHGEPTTMFIAGDDGAARATVAQLATDLGFDVADVGSLETAGLLEALALVWIRLATVQRQGRDIALRLVRR